MKPLVLVPYRDRSTHLECLIGQLQKHWSNLTICVCEQIDNGPWNKGLLFNIGYKLLAHDYDYIIQHDVDFIPVYDKVDYGPCDTPCMVAGEASQFNYRLTYPTFFGGVVILSKEHFEITNGHSNLFKGYGGEDDLQYRSFINKGVKPGVKNGRFECFAHPRPKRNDWYQHNLRVLAAGRDFNEGLSNCMDYMQDYTKENIITMVDDFCNFRGYIHIKIHTNENYTKS